MQRLLTLALLLLTIPSHAYSQDRETPTPSNSMDWPVASPADHGVSQPGLEALVDSIRGENFGKITSLLIARSGQIVMEEYFSGDVQTLRNTRSVTKSITGILIGIAIDQKRIQRPGMPIFEYIRERPQENLDDRKLQITITDLLTMSSLLECNDWNQYSRGNEERMYVLEDWAQFALDLPIKGFAPWETRPENAEYGRSFSYCTAGVFLLGRVLNGATGYTVGDYANQVLFEPLGIENVQWQYSSLNQEMTGGGLMMRTRDLAKIAQLYLDNGEWQKKRIVSESWVRQSMRPHARIDEETEYGYLWWLKTLEVDGREFPTVYMTGSGGNRVYAFPEQSLVVVLTTENFRRRDAHQLSDQIIEEYILPTIGE